MGKQKARPNNDSWDGLCNGFSDARKHSAIGEKAYNLSPFRLRE